MAKNILVVEDDTLLNQMMVSELREMGFEADGATRWADAQRYLAQREPALVILDPTLPDADGRDLLPDLVTQQPVIVLTAFASIQDAVQAMKAGAAEYLSKPVNIDELQLVVDRVFEHQSLRRDHQFFRRKWENRRSKFLVGSSPSLQEVGRLIAAVAPTDMTVLIQGESGVGKELVAREIHDQSQRQDRNFVAIDCCTLQETLFESELFGHEKGSFTGADRQKKGLIETAESGTLFLDEIGDISPTIQAKLLRFLETGIYRRLGGTKDLEANVRVVAATNANLEKLSKESRFRADLYYRLSAFEIRVPPLRDRRDDIPDLVNHFIANHDFSRRITKKVSKTGLRCLVGYDWPGNVRELRNVVERAIILSGDSPVIQCEHLPLNESGPDDAKGGAAAVSLSFPREPTLKDIERDYLQLLLRKYGGRRARVAQALGISERNTYRLIKKYGDDAGAE